LFASGPLGAGSAFALQRLVLGADAPFRPAARLREGRLARRFATCAMDTSDGLLAALDQLAAVNGVGFAVDLEAPDLLAPAARAIARGREIPPWVMLAGPHGEFELVFTLPPEQSDAFRAAAADIGWRPVRLGEVLPEDGVRFLERGIRRTVDVSAIRRLGAAAADDAAGYLAELLRLGS
jgi:thiamine-monophosphate kinase